MARRPVLPRQHRPPQPPHVHRHQTVRRERRVWGASCPASDTELKISSPPPHSGAETGTRHDRAPDQTPVVAAPARVSSRLAVRKCTSAENASIGRQKRRIGSSREEATADAARLTAVLLWDPLTTAASITRSPTGPNTTSSVQASPVAPRSVSLGTTSLGAPTAWKARKAPVRPTKPSRSPPTAPRGTASMTPPTGTKSRATPAPYLATSPCMRAVDDSDYDDFYEGPPPTATPPLPRPTPPSTSGPTKQQVAPAHTAGRTNEPVSELSPFNLDEFLVQFHAGTGAPPLTAPPMSPRPSDVEASARALELL
ncbi:hypothetical protein PHYPSEUDO_000497 [Phytophthora pseudosyringae]|uniref:Uncharacterized protein n=1 Tax=Phytophthora pseudosyringae TaxID=221518 RepID=A0A8T1W2E6_9STRA|nr:hypothetical protein PHYPSEUDO_000497 [Phytophthora pseudosyringae]